MKAAIRDIAVQNCYLKLISACKSTIAITAISIAISANPLSASDRILVCTNFSYITKESIKKISSIIGENPSIEYFIGAEKILDVDEIRVLIAPPMTYDVENCLRQSGHLSSTIMDRISVVVDRVGKRSQLYPGGPYGVALQTSDRIIIDGIDVWITAAETPEPFRSIKSITSMLGVNDTTCVFDAKCLSTMEDFLNVNAN